MFDHSDQNKGHALKVSENAKYITAAKLIRPLPARK